MSDLPDDVLVVWQAATAFQIDDERCTRAAGEEDVLSRRQASELAAVGLLRILGPAASAPPVIAGVDLEALKS